MSKIENQKIGSRYDHLKLKSKIEEAPYRTNIFG